MPNRSVTSWRPYVRWGRRQLEIGVRMPQDPLAGSFRRPDGQVASRYVLPDKYRFVRIEVQ